MGGIAGHAGLFSNVMDILSLTKKFMWAPPDSSFVNSTTYYPCHFVSTDDQMEILHDSEELNPKQSRSWLGYE